MKNIVRAFVAVLVLTGAVATTQTSSASAQTKVTAARSACFLFPRALPTMPTPAVWVSAAKFQ